MEDRSYLGAVNEVLIQLADSNSMVDASIKMLKELAEDLKSSGDVSAERLDTLREECKKLIAVKLLSNNLHSALEESTGGTNENDNITETFENKFHENDDYSERIIVGSAEYRSFDNYLRRLFSTRNDNNENEQEEDNNNMDADVRCTNDDVVHKDPFTQKQIVEGVKNKRCDHVYERSVILDLIETNRRHRKKLMCPYTGCTNTVALKENDLERI